MWDFPEIEEALETQGLGFREGYMSYSLNSLKGVYLGDCIGE